jgi:predicted transcriptional regulator
MGKGNPNGRPPSRIPRDKRLTVRLSEAEYRRLEEAAENLDTTKTEVIAKGIERIHAETVAKKSRK